MTLTYYRIRTIKNKNLIRYVNLFKHSLIFVNLKLVTVLKN